METIHVTIRDQRMLTDNNINKGSFSHVIMRSAPMESADEYVVLLCKESMG